MPRAARTRARANLDLDELGLHDSVQDQCQRILASPMFLSAERLRALFSYIVQETIAGRGDRLKAYAIGCDVLGRGKDFDPNTDPIVRIDAGRLRRALERYYFLHGQNDAVIIDIPSGQYAARFIPNRQPATPVQIQVQQAALTQSISPPRWLVAAVIAVASAAALGGAFALTWHRLEQSMAARRAVGELPTVRIEKLVAVGKDSRSTSHADGITEELFVQMLRSDEVSVFAPRNSSTLASDRWTASFVLAGNVSIQDARMSAHFRLIEAESSAVLWARTYRFDLGTGDPLVIDSEIAEKAVSVIRREIRMRGNGNPASR